MNMWANLLTRMEPNEYKAMQYVPKSKKYGEVHMR